jgi:2-polyprenyl-6-methoxyphenol hydroxylase-like FAD-dependent oxidoreductase
MRPLRVPVLIAGAGPIGLALAADLAKRGIKSMIVEQDDGRGRFARIMLIGVRTMEFCRRLGVIDKVKDWGFPKDFPFDNVWVTSLTGYELGRGRFPSLSERKPFPYSPESHGYCPQAYFDPILEDLVRSQPEATLRYQCKLESFEQDSDRVLATVCDANANRTELIEADYLVGCDGYTSTVRDLLGIQMRGKKVIDYSYSIEFRTENLASLHDKGNAGRYAVVGPEGTWATVLPVDGKHVWRMLRYTVLEDLRKIDVRAQVRRFVGCDFDFEILSAQSWTQRAVMAERFQDGRVFLAGDAGHTHVPNGGFGMNMGMADAMNLSWKLAAVLHGWGHPNLLDSYDIERRPVCYRTMEEAVKELDRVTAETRYKEIADDTPEGAEARRKISEHIRQEYEGMRNWGVRSGIHLGHIYAPSPIVVNDGTPLPPDDTWDYHPTSYPGARAPHAWISDGISTIDLFGDHFVLLRFGRRPPNATPLLRAAAQQGVDIVVHDFDDPAICELYERRLVLVRPDGHVGWRSDALPDDPHAVVARLRGAGPRAAARVRIAAQTPTRAMAG